MNTKEIAGSLFAILIGILYFVEIEVNMWTFHFMHDNIFHLCGNMLVLSSLYKHFDWKLFPLAYIVGSLSWLIAQNAIGASAILFFMLGSISFVNIKGVDRKYKIMYISTITLVLSSPLFIPKLSFTLHLIPFVVGFIIGMAKYLITKFNNDLKGVAF